MNSAHTPTLTVAVSATDVAGGAASRGETTGDVFERLAQTRRDAAALHAPERRSLSFANLGAQLRYVRERLGNWGIGRGDVVVGVVPPRPEMALACATVSASATFAPLSPALTTEGYCGLLARMRPKAILVPKGIDHPVRLAARRCEVADIGLVSDAGAPAGMFALELERHQRSLARTRSARPEWAYVLATSGTTGRPKLVPYSHRRITAIAHYLGACLRIAPSDTGCHLVPAHHSHGLNAALLMPLLNGASVVCLPESGIDAYLSALREYPVTWLTAVFSIHREILRCGPEFRKAVAGSRLRFMRTSSGRLAPDEIDQIENMFGAPLLVGYGTTEATPIAHETLTGPSRRRGSVGRPSGGEVAILGEAGNACLPGKVGEVAVRGPLVFDGYFDDVASTQAVFSDGWFRTGDLGRLDEDGYLHLVGRARDLINRGGEKISPAEIDTAIEAMPGVQSAATFSVPHQRLGEEVVTAVIKEREGTIEAADIIDHVRRHLGPRRVPRKIYFMDELPRTETGKIRRSELPRLLGLDRLPAEAVDAPRKGSAAHMSPLESALAGLWCSILQVHQVHADDDFFLLGGDSLCGARLLASVKEVFGIELPVEMLFRDAATVAGMARSIAAARRATAMDRQG